MVRRFRRIEEQHHRFWISAPTPSVTLAINLLATQATYEEDAFDEFYDEGANTATPPVPAEENIITFTAYDLFHSGMGNRELTDVKVDIYEFVANNFTDAYPLDEYKDWNCDFFVSTDKPVDEGLVLVGNYGTYGWLGFWAPENDQPYEPLGLLGSVSFGGVSSWTYQGIHDVVQIFRCGLIDYLGNNDGVTVTVELRMTSPDGLQQITITSIDVLLG